MAESTNNIIYNVQVDTKTGQINIDGLTKGFMQADKAVLKLQQDISKTTAPASKAMKGLGDASGSATSSVMELSRVVSDAPYGIRGMANNITQLVSQMGTATVKAGSLSAALKLMWKAMMGPLGIVFAITAAVSALDYFKGGMKKAKKESDKLNDTFGEQSTKLMVLRRALDSSSVSVETKNELVKKANEEFEGLNIKLDENAILTDESAAAIDRLSLSFIKNAKAKAIAALIQEEMTIQAKTEAKQAGADMAWYENIYYGLQSRILGVSAATSNALESDKESREEVLKDSATMVDKYIAMLTDKGGELALALFGDPKKKKTRAKKATILQTPKEFTAEADSLQSEIDTWDKKMLMAATKDKDQKLQLELIFYKKKKELRRKEQEDEAYDNLFKYEDSLDKLVKAGKMESAEAEKAKGDALIKTQEKVDAINSEHDRLIEKAEEVTKALRLGVDDGDKTEEQIELFRFKIGEYMKVFSSLTDFMNGESDRQSTIEENKTNKLNNELNKRLLNENLSKDERKRIQLQIGANDERLRIKQEQIERKRFKLNKAANMSQAAITTYLNATKAYASQLSLPTPDAPIRAKVAYGAAMASGMLSVASIARQKFQSSAGSGGQIGGGFGGGSGSGGNDRDFNFNLAGTSQQNQLAQTLQGRFDQPLQAYVVSTDITNQQQLDQEILGNATFG